jgi:hypothetical protein
MTTALWSVPYELFAVPVLFAPGLVARSLVWHAAGAGHGGGAANADGATNIDATTEPTTAAHNPRHRPGAAARGVTALRRLQDMLNSPHDNVPRRRGTATGTLRRQLISK